MTKNTRSQILAEYDRLLPIHEAFRISMERIVSEVLIAAGHRVHSVTSRVKDRSHLEAKIGRLTKHYKNLNEVTDVIGVRVTTYFEDEVDAIGKLIESEFNVDSTNSIDKRSSLDPDRFGYLSLHYVCGMDSKRSGLIENQRFGDLKFEVQVRSILQHAWAEIEHDLGYKAGMAIPAPIRRRFSRLAGLLEIADIEFARLRNDLSNYSDQVAEEIGKPDEDLELDKVSLKQFLWSEPLVLSIDRQIAAVSDVTLVEDDSISAGIVAEMLRKAGVTSIGELRGRLRDNARRLVDQYQAISQYRDSEEEEYSTVYRGISVFEVLLMTLAEAADDIPELMFGLSDLNIESGENRERLAQVLWDLRTSEKPAGVSPLDQ